MNTQLILKIQHEIARVTRISKQRCCHEDAPRIAALEDVLKWIREQDAKEVSELSRCDGAPDWIAPQEQRMTNEEIKSTLKDRMNPRSNNE